jgi:hypothetical protein
MAILSKDNAEFAVSVWQRIRGNPLRRYAGYLILAAIAAQSNIAQYAIMAAFAAFGTKLSIPETPYWFSGLLVVVAAGMLFADRRFPEKEKAEPKHVQELARLLATGEDIVRRQRIMTTSDTWRQTDPSVGVRNEEGALWREAVRRHINDKHPNDEKVLKELEWTLDIDLHIFDERHNRAQGTRAGFIESYLNHSYKIMSFLKKYG